MGIIIHKVLQQVTFLAFRWLPCPSGIAPSPSCFPHQLQLCFFYVTSGGAFPVPPLARVERSNPTVAITCRLIVYGARKEEGA